MNKPKVNQLSETFFDIPELGHTVKIQKKQGRTLLLCDCLNHTKFCNENPWCYHKQLVLEHIILKPVKQKLQELIDSYEKTKNIKDKVNIGWILTDLQDLMEVVR